MNTNTKYSSAAIAKLAMMTAISVVLLFIRIPFPPAPFLEYDPADIPIYITSFAYGPIAGLIVTFVVCFIQAFMMGGNGIIGFLMHFIATGLVAVTIGTIYKRNKTKKNAATALIIGVLIATVVMCIMNLLLTPLFMGGDIRDVIKMIVPIIIPFNLLKAGLNSLATFLVYKKLSGFLHRESLKDAR
ncbi:MAG: ECF transporter S component [Mogibacterium sp.]|nr:ECF transporter S component [Mogibacterium sp.]